MVGCMTSEKMGLKRFSTLSEGCEPLWLIHMEAEYIGFMVGVESEISLLEHIRGCRVCRDRLADIFDANREPADNLEETFAIDLPLRLGPGNSDSQCPVKIDYTDPDAFIEARIIWRLEKLRKLLHDAELELGHLSGRIKEEKNRSTP